MPAPTAQHLITLGPPVLPFERRGFDASVLDGEDIHFVQHLYDATDDGKPADVIEVNPETITLDPDTGRYLWVISAAGLHIVLEATPNPNSQRGEMCHTNITGGQRALQGGELWFGTNGFVYINYASGRYGAHTPEQEQEVINYFNFVGYENVEVIEVIEEE